MLLHVLGPEGLSAEVAHLLLLRLAVALLPVAEVRVARPEDGVAVAAHLQRRKNTAKQPLKLPEKQLIQASFSHLCLRARVLVLVVGVEARDEGEELPAVGAHGALVAVLVVADDLAQALAAFGSPGERKEIQNGETFQ